VQVSHYYYGGIENPINLTGGIPSKFETNWTKEKERNPHN
jgi:hypothetical protein